MIQVDPVVLTFVVGSVVPLVVALATKAGSSSRVKAVANVALSIGGGVLAFLVTHNGAATLVQLATAAIQSYLAAGVTYHSLWKPTGIAPAIAAKTPTLGV